jgi:NitT/TauT family transport system ATP-binding protein
MNSPIIALDGVTKRFKNQLVIDNISFTVRSGEIVTLLGQTGAGKSTILHLILGQIAPSGGQIRVDGHDPVRDSRQLRGTLAVSFQSDRLIPWRTARENVELGLEILRVPKNKRATLASEWLSRVKLAPMHHDKYPHQLSGGMRQRVSLARAMVIDPHVILLDESFSQLDPVTSRTLRADVLDLVRQMRKTCVLITHRIEDAVEMSDRVLVLVPPGRIHAEIELSDALRADPVRAAESSAKIAAEMAGMHV